MEHLIKLDAEGQRLPIEAESWVAVEDTSTKLIWPRKNVVDGRLEWTQCADACNEFRLLDRKDWIFPGITKVLSIVDYARHTPAIDTRFFDCESDWYWTSMPAAYAPDRAAWVVNFNDGDSFWSLRNFRGFVRACCASQS